MRTHDEKMKVKQWLGDWYPVELEGSDCKSIPDIGNGRQTWVKIGAFSFEAIKYSLKDYVDRVRSNEPERYKHSRIKDIVFEGGTLDGKTITFSPELNTFIGIRGSGKSSILEAIRYVLDIPFGEQATDIKYKRDLIFHTFGSRGKVIISAVDIYGQTYQIKRILNDPPDVYVDGKLQPGISIKETIIRNPIYFGQKDLSSSGEGFEKDLVEKLVGDKLNEIRKKIEDQKQILSEAIARFLRISNIDEQINEYTLKKQDAEFNLKKFNEYGVGDKFQKQLDFNSDERRLKLILNDITGFIEGYKTFISEYEDTIRNHATYKSNQNQDFFTGFFLEYATLIKLLDKYKAENQLLENTQKQLKVKCDEFLRKKAEFVEEFAETRRKIDAELKERGILTLNLEEFPQLKSKIEIAQKMLEALEKQKATSKTLKDDLFTALSKLNDLWQQEFQATNKLLERINSRHSSLVIEAEFKGDKTAYLSYMKNIFRGSGIRENTFVNLISDYSDFGALYRAIETSIEKTVPSSGIFKKYFVENLQSFLLFQVPNKFTIKYRGKELQHHSLGQRASALILFVLNQHENDVVIVDQPEDDLDNQTIYEDVIKLIKELKSTTQCGSIDSPVLQKEIVDIMEGGQDAFNKRKEIYGIWKPQN